MDPSYVYCTECGASNRSGARFCFACGQRLSIDSSASPSSPYSKTVAVRTPTGHLHLHQLLKQRYRILKLLDEGGMGSVYQAQDLPLGGRLVAIKEMSQKGLSSRDIADAAAAFKDEALMLAKLEHPHLPHIYDYFDEMGHWYLVMEFINGQTLSDYLARANGGRLSIQEALRISLTLCGVLGYLHAHKPPIIFRDLKPDNIMMTPDGHLYLIDFGIARHFKTGKARDTSVFFTFGYAAPEQYGQGQTSPLSDIYSLGATLHHLLSGVHPAKAIFRFAPLQLKGHPHAAELEALIMQMVELDENKRPVNITTVKQQLENIVAQKPGTQKTLPQPKAEKTVPDPQASKPSTSDTSASSPSTSHPSASSPPVSPQTAPGASTPQQPTQPQSSSTPPPSINELRVSHKDLVRSVAWSPDGTRLASGSKEVLVWNTSTGENLYRGPTSSAVRVVVWSPDGNYLASGGWDQKVHVWDATSGEFVFTYIGHTDVIRTVAWSPDGTKLASAGLDKTAQVWEAKTGNLLFTYSGHSDAVYSLAWSPDSKQLASVSKDKTVKVWEASTGQSRLSYEHEGIVYGVACSPNGKYLASCSEDKTVQVWDLTTKERLLTYSLHMSWIYTVAWSPDSQYIASAGRDKQVRVWEALTGNGPKLYPYKDEVLAVAWSPDGTHIAYGDGNVMLVKKVK